LAGSRAHYVVDAVAKDDRVSVAIVVGHGKIVGSPKMIVVISGSSKIN
jgi:hypothetical protein